MNHFISILAVILAKRNVHVTFDGISDCSLADLADRECYRALLEIRSVLDNFNANDFDCIEEIVRIMEHYGIGGGSRHDF